MARPAAGLAILVLLAWRLGTGPVVDGLRTVGGRSLAAATGITVVTTVGAAWRWSIVARGIGVPVPLPAAVAACYRSQFLNTVLPGGALGDVNRGLRHGREVADVGRALRVVAWDRFAGQAVQAVLAVVVLVTLPSPWRASVRVVLPVVMAGGLGIILLAPRRSRPQRTSVRLLCTELHDGLLASRAWPRIVLASVVVVVGHTAVFVIASRTAGSTASTTAVLPLAMLVMLAMSVPANVAGWGPREGVAAWAFGVAGLGSAHGVAAATVYGVLVFVAGLPGLAVFLLSRRPAAATVSPTPPRPPVSGQLVTVGVAEVGGRG